MDFLQYCRRLSGDEGYTNTLGTTTADGPNMLSKYNNIEEPVFDRDDDILVYDPPTSNLNRPKILDDRIPPSPKKKPQRYHRPNVTR
jgi:hypothetical protein